MRLTGKGSIEQLDKDKQPRYCRRWRVWQYADNKRHSRRVNGTYTQAQKELEKLRKELQGAMVSTETFNGYSARWLELRKGNPDFSPNTIKRDTQTVKTLQGLFGDYRLTDITPSIVQARLNERNGRSGTTMNNIYVRLNTILNAALDDDIITRNPCAKVKPPKIDTKEKKALSKEELNAFLDRLDALETDGRVMACYFMALQGLRRSEALGLMETDVLQGVTHVRRSLIEATLTLGKTKSNAGVRDLPQPQRLQDKIQEWQQRREFLQYEDVFCCNTQGGILAPQNLYKWFKRNFSDLDICLHELRHTNLTIMARELSVFGLKTWAGWSSIDPARIYIHDDNQELINAAKRLNF